jgi:hypothetical protein
VGILDHPFKTPIFSPRLLLLELLLHRLLELLLLLEHLHFLS